MNSNILREQPQSIEAERGLLGAILSAPDQTFEVCSEKISPSHFYEPAHRMIYSALSRMHEARKVIDIITATQFMRDDGQLDSVGGALAITQLLTFVPEAINAPYYIDILRRKFIRREIIRVCTNLAGQSYEDNRDEHVLLDEAQAEITGLAQETLTTQTLRHIREGIMDAIERLDDAYNHRGAEGVTGLATGIHDFDRMTGGLKPQQLVVIAARPSVGKTAIAMNMAEHIAVESKVPVAVFSMEMSYQEIIDRAVCSFAGVSLQRLRDGFLSKEDFDTIPDKSLRLSEAPIYIDDTRAMWITDFKARARRAVTRLGVGCIVIDYLQLMVSPSRRAQENRVMEITEITGALKATAKELNIPVIVCAQLNRDAEKRTYGHPKLADLRESGSIEQDADIVALLQRPIRALEDAENPDLRAKLSKYLKLDELNERLEYAAKKRTDESGEYEPFEPLTVDTYAQLIVAKQRNGPVGDIKLRYVSDITRFVSLTKKMWSNNPMERQTR